MKTLTNYLKKRKATIDFLLRKPSDKYTPNTFHKLRVEIKKLNSFFDLINFCSTDFKRKTTYKPFKSIFRKAGKVRELQIEDSTLKKYFGHNIVKDYQKNLKRLQLKAEEDFFLLINKKLMDRLSKKHLAIIPHLCKIDKKKLSTYIAKKENHLQEIIGQEIIQTWQIHKLRKQLKLLNYNKEIVNKNKQDESLSKQDVLSELLGKWHDCKVIIRHIKKALNRGQLSLTEVDQLKTIQSKIVQEGNILLDEIKNAIAIGVFEGTN